MAGHHLRYRFIKIFCISVSSVFLVASFLLERWWQILLIYPAILLVRQISKYQPGICIPSVLFGSYIFLASLGVWIGHIPHLMVYGSIMALAGWELQLFERGLVGNPQHSNIELLEWQHLKSLGIVIILGFLLTTVGLNLQLRFPFGIILLLVLLMGFLLERVYFYFNGDCHHF